MSCNDVLVHDVIHYRVSLLSNSGNGHTCVTGAIQVTSSSKREHRDSDMSVVLCDAVSTFFCYSKSLLIRLS